MRAGCSTKVRWETEEQADGHRLLMLHDPRGAKRPINPERLHVYQCPHCEGWHVGHSAYPLTGGAA